MAAREQHGGLQEVFVQTRDAQLDEAISSIEQLGGHVRHVYPPIALMASIPAGSVQELGDRPGIAAFETGEHEASVVAAAGRELGLAMGAWNAHADPGLRARRLVSPTLNVPWSAAGTDRLPPDPPPEIREQLGRLEAQHAPPAPAREVVAGGPKFDIPVLVGRVAVGLVLVDSTVAEYQITNDERSKVINETTAGLHWLAGFEPRANIQWFYDVKRPSISLPASQFTKANKNQWESLWRNAAMGAMGYSADYSGMTRYISDIRSRNRAQWSYAIFVTKYPKTWYAYEWENHVVMDFTVDGWGIDDFHVVVAHETGHVFGACDEYSGSGCSCTTPCGRYQVPNSNCETCAAAFVPCLWSHNSLSVCDYSRGALGWNDLAVRSEGSTTLKGTWTFDFDTGIQGPASGADVWWEQVDTVNRFFVPQSGVQLTHMGTPSFDAVSRQMLATQPYTCNPINGSNNGANQLTPGAVVAVKTNNGRYAKVEIESYGYDLGIKWVTYA